MDATILLLFAGLGTGYYFRERRARKETANTTRHTAALDHTIGALERKIAHMNNAEAKRLKKAEASRRYYEEQDISDTGNQIRFISQAELRAVPPVNKEAVRVLYVIEKWIATHRPDWRVAFEVSMGAFIKTPYDPGDKIKQAAFSSYNSKRVDFLLIDRFGQPMLAVEYHGTGHDLSDDASDRMEVKRLALARAQIPLVELPAKVSKAVITRTLNEKLLI
ncbi:DUF2726 domain-containing protein [Brucella pituitosa]|uniref:DUF2726 domain-containing protein n=1 Tax=Brucella pituitosa TaxID=571256 RepID=UPI0009A2264E|nr:DUF2726 domain-containing protein [Brucella pituitosa]